MRSKIFCLLISGLMFIQSGCATVVSGKTQDVTIRSNPTGAMILIDGVMDGQTPMIANLSRKQRHSIDVSHGGQKVTRATTRGFNWWYLGNIILGGLIGLIVDPCTGAIYNVKPDTVYVDFTSPDPSVESPANSAAA